MASESQKNDTPEHGVDSRFSLLKARLAVAKAFCKKPHTAMKRYMKEYEIDDWSDATEVRDKIRIGYIFRRTESDMPAIFDDQPDLFFKGKQEVWQQLQSSFETIYDWLWDRQSLEEVVEDAALYFKVTGMGFVSSPWVTKNKKVKEMQMVPQTDETGNSILDIEGQPLMVEQEVEYEVPTVDNPMSKVEDPFKLFFSPETIFSPVLDYEHCPYYFKERVITVDEVEARYGKRVDSTEALHLEDSELNIEIESELKDHKDDIKRVTIYEYYGCLPKWAVEEKEDGEAWRYDKDYHIIMTGSEELLFEESPYEIKPCKILGNYGFANKFWKFGDAKHLLPLVQELEQYRSKILGHTRKSANPKVLDDVNSNTDQKALRDPRSGVIVKFTGTAPSYLTPPPLSPEVRQGIDLVRTDLEKQSGTFDLASGSGQSQVKSPRGIQVFSEAAEKNIRRQRKKVARFIRELVLFQFKQLATNWSPDDPMAVEVLGEDTEVNAKVLQVLGDENIVSKLDIEVESLSVNRVQDKQDALELFDAAIEHPELFNITEIAKDLLQNGYKKKDADRYLISEQEKQNQVIQQFISQVGQASPELGGALAQFVQNPALAQMQQEVPLDENTQPESGPALQLN